MTDAPPGTTTSIGNDDATTEIGSTTGETESSSSMTGAVTSTSESTTGKTESSSTTGESESSSESTTGESESSSESTTGETESSSESTTGEEVVCADPSAGIPWAGDWGKRLTHGCTYTLGLPEPFVVDKSNTGHDCYKVTAEVWIPGVTDVDGNQNLIRTEMLLDDPNDAVELPSGSLVFEGRFGNNYRYSMSLGGWIYIPYGSYDFRFRFSYLDENIGCWYTIGLGDGPDGGDPRTLELTN